MIYRHSHRHRHNDLVILTFIEQRVCKLFLYACSVAPGLQQYTIIGLSIAVDLQANTQCQGT